MDYRYVFKELRRHHHRTLVNVVGIAVGIALFRFHQCRLDRPIRKAVSLPFKNLGADLVVQRPERRTMGSGAGPCIDARDTPSVFEPASPVGGSAETCIHRGRRGHGFFPCCSGNLTREASGPLWASTSRSRAWGRSKSRNGSRKDAFRGRKGEVVLEKHFGKFHHTKLGDHMTNSGGRDFICGGTPGD